MNVPTCAVTARVCKGLWLESLRYRSPRGRPQKINPSLPFSLDQERLWTTIADQGKITKGGPGLPAAYLRHLRSTEI